ncbi:MAG: T9SS type A sorting domain-containing protein [Bacteroidota bacterium]|nr:T9SS type A sorting domain-containing protein [Bacteroidota bacterium]
MKRILFVTLALYCYNLTAQDWQWCDLYKKHTDGNSYYDYNSATEFKYKLDKYDNLYGFVQPYTISDEVGKNKKDSFIYETFVKLGSDGNEAWRFELIAKNVQKSQFFLPNDTEIYIFTNYRPNPLYANIYNNYIYAGKIQLISVSSNFPSFYNLALIVLNTKGEFKYFKNLFIDIPSSSHEPQMVFLNNKFYLALENFHSTTSVTWKILNSNNDTITSIIPETNRKILFQMDSVFNISPVFFDTASIPFDIVNYDDKNIYFLHYKSTNDRHISIMEFNTVSNKVTEYNNSIYISSFGKIRYDTASYIAWVSSRGNTDTVTIDNVPLPLDITTNTNYYLLKYEHNYKLKKYKHIAIPDNFIFGIRGGVHTVKNYGQVFICYYKNLTDSILKIDNIKFPINRAGQYFIMIIDTDLNIIKINFLNAHINKLPNKKYAPLLKPTNILAGNCGNVYLFTIAFVNYEQKEPDSTTYNTQLYMGKQKFDISLLNNSASLFLFKYNIDTAGFTYSNTCEGIKLKQIFAKKYNSFAWYANYSLIGVGDSIVHRFNNHDSLLITCKASSNIGCNTVFSDSIFVIDINPHIVHLKTITDTFCEFNICHFKDSFYTDTATKFTWHWFFGDGTDSIVSSNIRDMGSINHIYTKSGNYSAKLLFNNGFCTDTFTSKQPIYITPAPQPGFQISPNNGCVPQLFNLKPLYSDTIVSEKYFIYNSVNNLIDSFAYKPNSPSIPIGFKFNQKDTGTIFIKQFLNGTTGCITQDSVSIRLNTRPYLKLFNDTFICSNEVLQLSGGDGPYKYLWNTRDTTKDIIINMAGTYWIKETNGGCEVSDSIIVSQDFNEHCKFSISIFPNPFGSEFNIAIYSRTLQNVNIQLYETTGKQVASYNNITVNQFATLAVNSSDLAAAMYILHITTTDKKFTYKVVKLLE